jgi:hypothetical protein
MQLSFSFVFQGMKLALIHRQLPVSCGQKIAAVKCLPAVGYTCAEAAEPALLMQVGKGGHIHRRTKRGMC